MASQMYCGSRRNQSAIYGPSPRPLGGAGRVGGNTAPTETTVPVEDDDEAGSLYFIVIGGIFATTQLLVARHRNQCVIDCRARSGSRLVRSRPERMRGQFRNRRSISPAHAISATRSYSRQIFPLADAPRAHRGLRYTGAPVWG